MLFTDEKPALLNPDAALPLADEKPALLSPKGALPLIDEKPWLPKFPKPELVEVELFAEENPELLKPEAPLVFSDEKPELLKPEEALLLAEEKPWLLVLFPMLPLEPLFAAVPDEPKARPAKPSPP